MKRFFSILLCLAIILSIATIFACALKDKEEDDSERLLDRPHTTARGSYAFLQLLVYPFVVLFAKKLRKESRAIAEDNEGNKNKSTQWHCSCGRDNPSYTHTCVCGRQKRDVLLSENKEENGQ